MTSVLDGSSAGVLLGDQHPRLWSVPPHAVSSAGSEAVDLAAKAGLVLDPWQQLVLEQSLGERAGGRWAAFEVAVIVSRQNGKGAILEARELAGLFLFGEELILHSAHEFKTAAEAFRRIQRLIQDNREFEREVAHIRTAAGAEAIELRTGQRLRFVARSSGSGRGFTGDCVILDEAYNLGDAAMAALLPTLSARPNPQVWYTSSAGMETSVQLGRVRERGLAGGDPSLAFFEWSVDPDRYDPADPEQWALANPGLGIRISADYVARERAALAPDAFARERLGIGSYPTDLANAWQVISQAAWGALADNDSELEDPVAFGLAVRPDERSSSIAVAGRRSDGCLFVELIEHRPGTAWVRDRLLELDRQWEPCAIVADRGGPAGSLIDELVNASLRIEEPQVRQVADAAEQFYDAAVDSKRLRHLGDVESQRPLRAALAAATKRPLRDKWTWERQGPVDASPLEAVTLAAWGYQAFGAELGPGDVTVAAL